MDPAANKYRAYTTVGLRNHDPTKWQSPGYSIGQSVEQHRAGLGPGLYRVCEKTRYGPSTAPQYTMGTKLPDLYHFISPGPLHYRPEKFYNAQQIPPKFTMGKRTTLRNANYVPSANSYTLPSTLGPCVPDKPCNGAFTIGAKHSTPRGSGLPAPNKYGPVTPGCYKPAAPQYTMGAKLHHRGDKTQKPPPNKYCPRKDKRPEISFGRQDSVSRMILFTADDLK